MTRWHGYFGVENLGLNAGQRQTLIEELRQLGPASNPQPCNLNHWRTRLDSEAAIFEALFNEDNLTVARFKQWLAEIFGVNPQDIGNETFGASFAGGVTTVVDFSYNAIERLRFALFGGQGCTWRDSGDECRGYLAQNRDEWE